MRVWVTRARPGADATADRLRDAGHAPVIAPLLVVRDLAPALDLDGVGALAFTSANGVRAFAALTPRRDWPAYAVGAATAEAAREAGFASVRSAEGDVDALAALILGDPDRSPGAVLHPGAREPAGDLCGALRGGGLAARALVVYETVAAPVARAPSCDAVLVHSPRAARLLAEIPGARRPAALCISPAAAAPLRAAGWDRVLAAPEPTEAALLALLDEVTPPARLPPVVLALMLFGLVCVIGGLLVARLGPQLFPAPEAAAPKETP